MKIGIAPQGSATDHPAPRDVTLGASALRIPCSRRATPASALRSIRICLLALATTFLASQPSLRAGVVAGPITNPANGHVYYFLGQNTWIASESEAVSLGGHLATINDAAENAWVWATFGGGAPYVWIGLADFEQPGSFAWMSGEQSAYRHWATGEPSGFEEENYVYMGRNGEWYDEYNEMWPNAVVEIDPSTAPDVVLIGTRKYLRTESKVNSGGFESNQRANLAVLSNGSFAVSWHEGGPTDCYGRIYGQNGNPLSGAFSLHPYGSGGWQYGPSSAALPSGALVSAWGGASSYVHGQRFSNTLSPVGGELSIANLNGWPAVASHANGEFVIAFGTTDSAVYARRYDANGNAGNVFQVGSYVSGWYHPSVAYGPDGCFAIAWPAGGNIYARCYRSSESTPFGPDFKVNSTGISSCYSPSAQYDQNNRLIVAWSGASSADSQGIFLRRFGPDGSPVSAEILVNENAAPSQSAPNLAVGPANGMFITWRESNYVCGRMLDANAVPVGHQLRVNKYTTGSQITTDSGGLHGCAILDNANLAVGWSGDGVSGGGAYVTLLHFLLDAEIRITVQPTNRDVFIGENVAFISSATSEEELRYQWQHNAINIARATNNVLTLTNVQLADTGGYRCLISNSVVSRASQEAILKVMQYPMSARQLYEMGHTNNGVYTIDPDGPGGQAPLSIYCLMSLSGGGWTKLTAPISNSPLNGNTNLYREYLYVKNNTSLWYRSPISKLVWSWTTGKDLYGTYYYSGDGGEKSFKVTPSGEQQLYGVGGSSGPSGTAKCLIHYWDNCDPTKGQVQICQDIPGIFGASCDGPVSVYIREVGLTNLWPLFLAQTPTNGGAVTGAGNYPDGLRVPIAATAAPGYQFAQWIGDTIEDTNAAITTILMTGPRTVTAKFVKVWHLSVAADPADSGVVTGGGDYPDGQIATITAESGLENWFLGWLGDGVANTNAPVTTVLMNRDRQVTARFSAPDFQVTNVVAPTNAIAGQLVRVSWTISNSGTAGAVGDWADRIWLSADNRIGGDSAISTNPVSTSVFVDSSVTRSQNIFIPPSFVGTFWLVAEANYDRGMSEYSYSNNFAITRYPIVITPAPYPNLQVSDVFTPTNAFAGQQIEARWVVTNAGPRSTESAQWEDAVFLSTDTQWDTSDVLLGAVPNPTFLAANQAYSSRLSFMLPIRIQGSYYLLVQADYRKRVNEGGLDGDNTRASNPIQVNLPGWPDLQVRSVFSPYEGFSGQPATITWSVTNAGSWVTGESAWQDRIYLSTSPTPGPNMTPLASVPHSGAMETGQAYTNSQQVILPVGVSGTNFYFLVQADANNDAWEYVFENNNYGASTHPTEIHLTPPPDLEVISVSMPSNVCAGFDLPVNYRVSNNGANDTPNYSWQDGFYLSTDASFDPYVDTYLGSVPHSGQLLRGHAYDGTANVRIPQNVTGNRYLIVLADSQDSVFELDKTNNHRASAFPVNILPLADLRVASVTVPSGALSGFDFSVVYSVTNTGPSPTIAGSWTDAFYLSSSPALNVSSATLLGTAGHSGQLLPGGFYTNNVTLRLPIGLHGNYYLFVLTDSQGGVPEQNESNNFARSVSPLALQLPSNDLQVSVIDHPTNALSGFDLSISCIVMNTGTNSIPNTAWRDAFYLSVNETLDTNDLFLGESEHTAPLAGRSAYDNSLTVRLPDGVAGKFYVLVVTDSRNVVFEQDESNNIAHGANQIAIKSMPPDLVVEAGGAPAGTYIAGTSLPVTWTVRNIGLGQTTVSTWADRVVLSRDAVFGNADDSAIATFDHSGALITNQAYSQSVSIPIPGATAASSYSVFVQTDAGGQVYEGAAKTNNYRRAGQITVIRPDVDLVATGIAVTNEAYSGQNLLVSWTVRNLGNSPANPSSWSDYIYLSREPQLSTNSILIGTNVHSGGLSASAAYTVTNALSLPWEAQGDYYLIVSADGIGQVPESREDNNDSAGVFPLYIYLSPTPDLLVTAIHVPAQALSGQPMPISWTVLNNGSATPRNWYDAVYLSFDEVFERSTDLYLGYVEHREGLDQGSSYAVTNAFNIPSSLYGTVYVFVLADSTDRVYERQAEANNLARSTVINVDLPPLSDLVVTAVSPPSDKKLVGESATVSYTVLNQSANPVNGRWEDTLFLSTDPSWDIDDTLLGKVAINRSLGPWESYSGSLTVPVPAVVPGPYYVIVRDDIHNCLPEGDKANNVGVSGQTFPIEMIELQLGVPYTNQLSTGAEHFYRVNTPSNETLAVTLDSVATNGFNELFTRFAAVPNRAQYDFVYSNPFAPDQQNTVPDTSAGYYYNLARGQDVPVSLAAYTIEAATIPFGIRSVTPSRIGDNGQVTITLKGAKFQPGAAVTISRGGTHLIAAKVVVIDPSTVKARFYLTNAPHGAYDVSLTNADFTHTTRSGPVNVENATGLLVQVAAAGNLEPRLGTPLRTEAVLANSGNVDVPYCLLIGHLGRKADVTLKRLDRAGAGETNHYETLYESGFSGSSGEYSGSMHIVRNVEPGSLIPFELLAEGFGGGQFPIQMAARPLSEQDFHTYLVTATEQQRQTILSGVYGLVPPELQSLLGDEQLWWNYMRDIYTQAGLIDVGFSTLGVTGGKLGRRVAKDAYSDCLEDCMILWLSATATCLSCLRNPTDWLCWTRCAVASTLATLKCSLCVQDCPPGMFWHPCAFFTPSPGGGLGGCIGACVRVPVPKDPNEKVGPSGVGTSRFVAEHDATHYTVHFENVADASAVAREVYIVDKLGSGLDPRSVLLREIACGGYHVTAPSNVSFYQTRFALGTNLLAEVTAFVDVQAREIRWTLRAIDRTTGAPPESAQIGLLPPNDATHRGEGYVTYTVQPVTGVRTGTVITNIATIVFDNNEPIETNPVWNTIDSGAPSSSVARLASVVLSDEFAVSWAGTDDAGGSGVQGYDIYVSDNGEAYQLWLANSEMTTGVYSGQAGHTYAFYSIARDNVGNLESAPAVPDAATTVISNHAPVLQPIEDRFARANEMLVITNVATDADLPKQKLTFALVSGPSGASISPETGKFFWTPVPSQGSTTNLITVRVSDNGTPPLSDTRSFTVTVYECVEASLGSTVLAAGQSGAVPIQLLSTVELTNLAFTVVYPADRFTSFQVTVDNQVVVPPHTTNLEAGRFRVAFDLPADRILHGPTNAGSLVFTALSNQSSAFVPLEIVDIDGLKPSGQIVANAFGQPGRVVVVGQEPLLEGVTGVGVNPVIILYGPSGEAFTLFTGTNDLPHIDWIRAFQVTPTNLLRRIEWPNLGEPHRFFKAVRE